MSQKEPLLEEKPKHSLKSNRPKAVAFMLTYCFSLFFFMIGAKIAMSRYEVNGLDLGLLRTMTTFVFSLTIALCSPTAKFSVER
jgi:hypothetical protein